MSISKTYVAVNDLPSDAPGDPQGIQTVKLDHKSYYKRIRAIPITIVIEALNIKIMDKQDEKWICDCPVHASQSHTPLHVNVKEGTFYCFGCGVGGDLIQLVEFIRFKKTTKGKRGKMPDSHRQARDYLGGLIGLQPLSDCQKNAEESRVLDCLTAIADHYHQCLLDSSKHLEGLKSHYGLTDETISKFRVGWANNLKTRKHLHSLGFTDDDMLSTGAFTYDDRQNAPTAIFKNRYTFPYLNHGRVVYMIGRITEESPDWEQKKSRKYIKLPIHNKRKHSFISPSIKNTWLFNEDVLDQRPHFVIETEGVTDAISLIQARFPVISPVTVQIPRADRRRIVRKLKTANVPVYIANDYEASRVGGDRAEDLAKDLTTQGIQVHIVTLPLDEEQAEACEEIADRFDIDSSMTSREVAETKARLSVEDLAEYKQLAAIAKQDVNRYFLTHTAGDFQALLDSAPRYEIPPGASIDTESPDAIHRTDMGNARRLASAYGSRIRYCPGLGFLVYDGRVWISDNASLIQQYAKDTVRLMYQQAADITDSTERRDAIEFALRSENASRLQAMIQLLLSEPGISISHDIFDRDPYLFNVPNGTLDLRTGTLRPHNPSDYITKMGGVPYDPDATCPLWEKTVCECADNDDNLIAFLQRFYSYCMTALTKEQVWALFYGGGENGKGVETDTLAYVMGNYCVNTPAETFLETKGGAIRNDLARLRGARLITASEPPAKNKFDPAVLKSFTGQDPITARFLHKEFIEFKPVGKIIFSANHRPDVRDTSHGFWRRMLLVPFIRKFSGKSKDKDLREKLQQEGPGILAWLVRGCLAWQREGLNPPQSVIEAVSSYRNATDVLADFIEGECTIERDSKVAKAELYGRYIDFCEEKKIKRPLSRQKFNEDLCGRDGIREGRDNDPKRTRIWHGVTLKVAASGEENQSDAQENKGKSNTTNIKCKDCDALYTACPVRIDRRDQRNCIYFQQVKCN